MTHPAAPTTSRIPAAISEMLTRFRAAAPDTALVIDGPRREGDDGGQVLYVGYQGDPSDLVAVDFTQSWRGLGARRKMESFGVRCAVVCWSGDDDDDALSVLRGQAFALLAMVETVLRPPPPAGAGADPALGFPPPTTFALAAGQLLQDSPQRCRIPFVVQASTRI